MTSAGPAAAADRRRGRAVTVVRHDRPARRRSPSRSSTVIVRRPVASWPLLAQRAQRLGHRLPRRADPARQLVLRQRDGDPRALRVGLAEALGQLDDPLGHPGGGVVGGELDALAVGVAQPLDDEVQQRDRDRGRGCRGSRGRPPRA